MQLANYLFFTTTCEQALAFYETCGLGRVTEMKRYGRDMPPPVPAMDGKIMHARFEGPGILFYASDNHDAEPMRGSAHFIMTDSRADTERLFGRLAEEIVSRGHPVTVLTRELHPAPMHPRGRDMMGSCDVCSYLSWW